MPKTTSQSKSLVGSIETLEERLVMSADPLLGGALDHHSSNELPVLNQHVETTPDFWRDAAEPIDLDSYFRDIEQQLNSAHELTGLPQVQEDYGFTGKGQTIAVIDSGIAYDHYALGGGLGAGYRVVGGWDFTEENDADPYDDGPSGSHGTHVAGIIGSDDGDHEGVAPGVDLVGLRVFNDVGAGYFHWVESALQWVHEHRNDYANPITAINLSLGVSSWNSSSIPSWANLEDEFAQLEADGIFIAVSAGNSYGNFNTPGLSYPAASPYVIPVMSADDSGNLSYFSQRHQRAIAAPGRNILSTAPDYKGNGNGVTDDFQSKSGTSMASPYVAGASALVRQAMEFVGQTGITQDTIYGHMLATADSLFDAATGLTYSRLNIRSAIDALMPSDDYGSDTASAYDLGTISDSASVNGLIGKLDDADFFRFNAGSTGTVTFSATSMTHDLAAQWTAVGGRVSGEHGEVLELDVIAGKSYTVGFASAAGLGYFELEATLEASESFTFTDWGVFAFGAVDDVNVAGGGWYRIEAAQAGFMTVQGQFDLAAGELSFEIYSADMVLLDSGETRVDALAGAGEAFFVHVVGSNSNVDFQLTNLVNFSGGAVTIAGSADDDAFTFSAGDAYLISVNGVEYEFDLGEAASFNFSGGSGNDVFTAHGSSTSESATLRADSATLESAAYTVNATSVESSTIHGGGGSDVVRLYDSAGRDTYRTYSDRVEMTGKGFSLKAYGFSETHGYASEGFDTVYNYDSAGDDVYEAWHDRTVMTGDGYSNFTDGFELSYAYATTGRDSATLYDSAGDDVYRAWNDLVFMSGAGFFSLALDFDSTTAVASTGSDHVYMYDSAGDDLHRAWSDRVVLSGNGYSNDARGFDASYVYGSMGNDSSYSYGTAGDDIYESRPDRSVLSGNGFSNYVQNFDRTYSYGRGGDDQATFYDSTGNDLYESWHDRAAMSGENFYNYAQDFARTYAYSRAGNDVANVNDSAGDDSLSVWSTHSVMSGVGFHNYSEGFATTNAVATTGDDRAIFYDSVGDDQLAIRDWGVELTSAGSRNRASNFDSVAAHSSQGGKDSADIDAVDYVFDSVGNWE